MYGRPSSASPGVVDADHVRVREPRCEPGLAQEALAEVGVAGEVLGQQLDRHRPVQLLVLREVDRRHAAVPERSLEPVAADQARGTPSGGFLPEPAGGPCPCSAVLRVNPVTPDPRKDY